MENQLGNKSSPNTGDIDAKTSWKYSPALLFVFILLLASAFSLVAQTQKSVVTEMSAEQAYQDGFTYDVMNTPSRDGIRIVDRTLLENDGAGAGASEKGAYLEFIDAGVLARKQFYLDDPRAQRAHVVLYMTQHANDFGKPAPYYLIVNGKRIPGSHSSWLQPQWQWVEIPVSLLREGLNEVIVGSDAPKGKGNDLLFAREDEYNDGGAKFTYDGNTAMISADQVRLNKEETNTKSAPEPNSFMYFRRSSEEIQAKLKPIHVGASSAKSLDGGKTWLKGKLGPRNNVSGEYAIRLSLDRFKPEAMLDSPPIDLWSGIEGYPVVRPVCRVEGLRMDVAAFVPEGAEVIWQARMANTNDMLDKEWGTWQTLGSGASASFQLPDRDMRYLQWRAFLKTRDPLVSPVVKNVSIHRQLSYDPPPSDTYYVTEAINPAHHYSSFRMSYENASDKTLKLIRDRLKIDSLIKDAHGDFEKINRIRHFVSGLWRHTYPMPEYPEWNALKVLDRNERLGAGGMCIQFSVVFMQALQSLGYNVRHINIFTHESVEVYVDELGAWVHVDPWSFSDSYEFNASTGKPLGVLEQHQWFLKELGFSAANPIDWTNPMPWTAWSPKESKNLDRFSAPIGFSTFTDYVNNPDRPPFNHRLAGFIRFIPRNDFLSRPYPRPLTQGVAIWPWNGYINWYDSATPRRLEYALHTDRPADFYPTLNRVEYSATYDTIEGQINIHMITVTPNFETFEINIDEQGWQPSPDKFTWRLRPAARNTLRMRIRNAGSALGEPSGLEVFWHYREPYKPRATSK
ncbi:MAG: transglutaminase domain-containing protein [Chitinophagaceae bacterium]|nr:transglutaminase domain-containing protein [Chitinophagaceae bacterium]